MPESSVASRDDLVARDRRCVIHPYAAPISSAPLFAVERAEGVRLTLTDGRELVDGMSSWWAAIHGYAHPALMAAVRDQLGRMSHVMFGGLTHEPAVALCETLVAITPEPLTRVFLADSGSVSVEVAIKLALQFFLAQGRPEKRRLISVLGGYHGDTFGAMAVTDPVGGMHHLFRGALAQHLFAPAPGPAFDAPWSPDAVGSMAALLEQHAHEVAAVILEPIAQNAGGMRFYHPQYLRELRALCDRHGVLLILDEIATNFGRTGELFACQHAGVAPDIMCLGKALTGGTMTLAAALCTERVAETIAGNAPGAFMHGPTYMGNPLACSAALASIRLLLGSPWRARVSAIEAQLRRELAPCRALDAVADVRVLGAIGVVELKQPVDMARVQPAFVERGVWLRPFGKLVYTMPPYIIDPGDLSRITGAIVSVVSEL
ncbi:adenosylmethionine--8-amino-7-oxononanoate transaminase [Sorangium cellulosum]|uniref:Adenosylmethionine-8-amino-7-oxononanoate aminotransferase n=1 Tax=Sorangium cellulosum TaxID=56 RepID=A0A150QX18_SORCE|nr:adenosylmethionine--8-amino-7-oxononanoate transaminase [Sorangium cellulosum]KYF72491.1 adenosylmethionine-8-amino-7-oxononanoate aminotransferase [Sorangium cellulosum]